MKSEQPERSSWTAEHDEAASAELRRWIARNCSNPTRASKKIKRHSGIVAALISAAVNDAGISDRVVAVSAATLDDYELQIVAATSGVGHVTRRISLTVKTAATTQSEPRRKARQAGPATPPRRTRDHKETYRRRNEKAKALGYQSYAAMRKATRA